MRISDWSSDVCSSDLDPDEDGAARGARRLQPGCGHLAGARLAFLGNGVLEIENDGIRLARERLLDLALVMARHEEQRSDHRRRHQNAPIPRKPSSGKVP